MKAFKIFILLLFFVCAFAPDRANAQFYSIQTEEVCWTTGAGVDSTIYRTDFYAVQTARPTFVFDHTIGTGATTPTAVTVTGGTIRPGSCETNIDSMEMNISSTLNSFSAAPDTIAANTVYEVVIDNLGTATHNIFVDGTSVRLYPGERYQFSEYFDEKRRRMVYNPQIIITQGTAGINNTRVTETPKN